MLAGIIIEVAQGKFDLPVLQPIRTHLYEYSSCRSYDRKYIYESDSVHGNEKL